LKIKFPCSHAQTLEKPQKVELTEKRKLCRAFCEHEIFISCKLKFHKVNETRERHLTFAIQILINLIMQQTQRATVKVHSFAVFRFQLKKRTTDVAGQTNQSVRS